jgi:D-proline reductase (dithiol) PrdB
MARLEDSVENERRHLETLECNALANPALTPPRPMTQCRVALISSAGLMQRNDDNVPANANGYRRFNNSVADADLLINHVSINFDRSAFAEDPNSVFPRQLLAELEQQRIIEHAADTHYAFMGATAPELLEPQVHELAAELKTHGINTACLFPV